MRFRSTNTTNRLRVSVFIVLFAFCIVNALQQTAHKSFGDNIKSKSFNFKEHFTFDKLDDEEKNTNKRDSERESERDREKDHETNFSDKVFQKDDGYFHDACTDKSLPIFAIRIKCSKNFDNETNLKIVISSVTLFLISSNF